MYVLGINAVFHDSSAALLHDGKIIAAAEEERFTRIKHAKRPIPFSTWELPFHAIDYCLKEAGIVLRDVDHVAYSFDPALVEDDPPQPWDTPWTPLFLDYVRHAPAQLADGAPLHLERRFRGVRADGPYEWHYVDHHVAHAASAFLVSPFPEAAVMTLDGRGEKTTTSYSMGSGTDLVRMGEVQMPHSLGLLYEEFTRYLGFLHSADEYKVMALASYGRPEYVDDFRQMVRRLNGGQYRIENVHFSERFGPPRRREDPLEPKHFNLARSLQVVLEETVIDLARWLRERTSAEKLCLAGGVALNCAMNARLRDSGLFEDVWVQPAAGDAGTSLGAALWVDHKSRSATAKAQVMHHTYWGPQYSVEEIETFLHWSRLPYRRLQYPAEEVAELLARDYVIGWHQGRMEFGPRALGGRSILASPVHASMQQRLNDIKDREDFRPVAPVILEEEAPHWFKDARMSPYMLFVFDILPGKAELIPAVRHVDNTARIQTINREQHPQYYDLLKAFHRKTGVPVLVNTSFNTRGEPMVCSPRDSIESFWTSPLDALVIGPFILEKEPASA